MANAGLFKCCLPDLCRAKNSNVVVAEAVDFDTESGTSDEDATSSEEQDEDKPNANPKPYQDDRTPFFERTQTGADETIVNHRQVVLRFRPMLPLKKGANVASWLDDKASSPILGRITKISRHLSLQKRKITLTTMDLLKEDRPARFAFALPAPKTYLRDNTTKQWHQVIYTTATDVHMRPVFHKEDPQQQPKKKTKKNAKTRTTTTTAAAAEAAKKTAAAAVKKKKVVNKEESQQTEQDKEATKPKKNKKKKKKKMKHRQQQRQQQQFCRQQQQQQQFCRQQQKTSSRPPCRRPQVTQSPRLLLRRTTRQFNLVKSHHPCLYPTRKKSRHFL